MPEITTAAELDSRFRAWPDCRKAYVRGLFGSTKAI
jgi:hypothetical protein